MIYDMIRYYYDMTAMRPYVLWERAWSLGLTTRKPQYMLAVS